MTAADRDLVDAIRHALAVRGDRSDALQMQRYMKSAMPYRGVRMPETRRLTRAVLAEHPLVDVDGWQATVLALFDQATYREERYAALVLLGHRRHAHFLTPKALPLLEHVIVEGAWWDIVDDASHRVGDVLARDAAGTEPVLRRWVGSSDTWLRRAAIIAQLGHREHTDVVLLADAIEAAMHEREFFLRKAIGWALREYARTDPGWVRHFVAEHDASLSPLSKREALKHLVA